MVDFTLPWEWKNFTDVHYIAVYYSVKIIGGNLMKPLQFDGQVVQYVLHNNLVIYKNLVNLV